MARGWESKSVEDQIEAAERRVFKPGAPALTAAQIEIVKKRESIELTRKRVVRELDATLNPRYQQQLRKSLAHLDEQLRLLSDGPAA